MPRTDPRGYHPSVRHSQQLGAYKYDDHHCYRILNEHFSTYCATCLGYTRPCTGEETDNNDVVSVHNRPVGHRVYICILSTAERPVGNRVEKS